jgi:hypothetical protein
MIMGMALAPNIIRMIIHIKMSVKLIERTHPAVNEHIHYGYSVY